MVKVRVENTSVSARGYSKQYKDRLLAGRDALMIWFVQNYGPLQDLPRHAAHVDRVLCDYVNAVRVQGCELWVAKHALLYAQAEKRTLRHKLPLAWDAISVWQNSRPTYNRFPVPLLLLKAMFAVALNNTLIYVREAQAYVAVAILIRVAFWGLLRPMEFLSLTVRDILIAENQDGVLTAILALVAPKNRLFFGKHQYVIISEAGTVKWLQWYIVGRPPAQKLWPFARKRFVTIWQRLLQDLDLSALPLTLACLRPGGVTHLITRGADIGRLKFLGRWRSEISMHAYVQEAVAHAVWMQMSPQVQEKLRAICDATAHCWVLPPLLATAALFTWRLPSQRCPPGGRPPGWHFGRNSLPPQSTKQR